MSTRFEDGRQVEPTSGMRRVSLDELHTIQRSILERFDRFCAVSDLTYMLAAGTLLGAVRHEGFIPWDDDVDVMLPRADFDRLVSMCDALEKATQLHFRAQNGPHDGYPYPFAKLMEPDTLLIESHETGTPLGLGINIDVFPLDGWPDGTPARRGRELALNALHRAVVAKIAPSRGSGAKRLVARATSVVLGIVPVGRVAAQLTRLGSKTPFGTSRSAGIIVWGYQERVPTDAYLPPKPLRFEGLTLRGPRDPDAVLTQLYGDYLTPPPPEARVLPHDPRAYVEDAQRDA